MSELPSSNQPTGDSSSSHNSGAWIGGAVLIGIGVVFLLQNLKIVELQNWWALFILLGTVGAWSSAWRIYTSNGHRMTRQVLASFVGGLFPLGVALFFLLNLNWGMYWPLFLILAGLAALVGAFGKN